CSKYSRLCAPTPLMSRGGEDLVKRFKKPSAPSPTAISGAIFSPRLFASTSSSRQLCALSRTPTWKPMSSFLPSGVAPISTSMHSPWSSMRACRKTPSAHTYTYRRAERSRFCPALVLALPLRRQSGDHRRREIRRIVAQERRQRLLEVARRDAPQVEHRQKCVQGLRAPCPQRQDRRSEANPVAIAGRSAISNLHPGDLDSADPRLDRSRRAVAVPHEAVAAVGKLQAIHRGKKRLGFHLDSLRKQLPCTRSQDIRQWIVDLVGLTQ